MNNLELNQWVLFLYYFNVPLIIFTKFFSFFNHPVLISEKGLDPYFHRDLNLFHHCFGWLG